MGQSITQQFRMVPTIRRLHAPKCHVYTVYIFGIISNAMNQREDKAVKIVPLRRRPGIPARSGATVWQIASGRLREWLGRVADRMGMPGFVRRTVIEDELTGQTVVIEPGRLFTRINVDGRDYYFRRLSGRFDGVGVSVGGPTSRSQSGYTRGRVRR